jgi:hypothetical protein
VTTSSPKVTVNKLVLTFTSALALATTLLTVDCNKLVDKFTIVTGNTCYTINS